MAKMRQKLTGIINHPQSWFVKVVKLIFTSAILGFLWLMFDRMFKPVQMVMTYILGPVLKDRWSWTSGTKWGEFVTATEGIFSTALIMSFIGAKSYK